MAYTSLIPVRRLDRAVKYVRDKAKTTKPRSLEEAVDYALNRDKTESVCFETGLSCLCETAFADMRANNLRWHKTGGVQGYHLVQSFAEGEVTPELAHQIGVELADQLLGGRYQAVVTTHLNTRHIHNHIVWCAVALDNGRKYHSNAKSYYTEVRAKSDALCRQYGLSVIETPESKRGKRQYAKWQAEANGQPTWRTAIRMDIDETVSMALTWRQFLALLEQKGYEIHMGRKYPTLRPPGKERFVRFKTLGKAYTPEAIRQRILYPKRPFTPAAGWCGRLHGTYRKARKLTGLRALYYRYLYELGALPRKSQRPRYAVRQDIRNLDKRIRQMEFLARHKIDTLAQLGGYRQAQEQAVTALLAERRQLYRVGPSDAIKTRLEQITQALKLLRRDIRLCRQIAEQSVQMRERLKQRADNLPVKNPEQDKTRERAHQSSKRTQLNQITDNDGGMPMKDDMNTPDRWAYRREYAERNYPPGTRIRLIEMPNDPAPVPAGSCGTVLAVDDAGQLLMRWDNGRSLSLIPGVDNFEVLERPRQRDALARANRSRGEAR